MVRTEYCTEVRNVYAFAPSSDKVPSVVIALCFQGTGVPSICEIQPTPEPITKEEEEKRFHFVATADEARRAIEELQRQRETVPPSPQDLRLAEIDRQIA